MAKKKHVPNRTPKVGEKRKGGDDAEALRRRLAAYEDIFGEVDRFTSMIGRQESEVIEAETEVAKAKVEYDAKKAALADVREARDGTKHAMYMYLAPGTYEIMPLFDRMEPADEDKHGANADEWRKEPIAALRLSFAATNALTAADVIFVGQLQDRMQEKPTSWWESIAGISGPMAAAIGDRMADFINERTTQ